MYRYKLLLIRPFKNVLAWGIQEYTRGKITFNMDLK